MTLDKVYTGIMNKYPKLSDLKTAGVPTGREAHLRAEVEKKVAAAATRIHRQDARLARAFLGVVAALPADARGEFVDIFRKSFK
jgi:hypothetical protein